MPIDTATQRVLPEQLALATSGAVHIRLLAAQNFTEAETEPKLNSPAFCPLNSSVRQVCV